jgi:peptidoglycan/xylan/chitin deacetylase (PgdA/CDA1 family)
VAAFRYFRTPFLFTRFYPTLTWRIHASSKELFLTFDDGPVPGPTEFVLDTLRSFNAKGTFFFVGENIYRYPHIYARVLEEGHRAANHTHRHIDGWKHKSLTYVKDVEECQAALDAAPQSGYEERITGKPLFRPPFGHIRNAHIKMLMHYNIVMWDVLTYDFDTAIAPEKCLQRSINATRDGSIVVFHDSFKAEKNLRHTLPRYLEHFSKRGFSFRGIV